MTTHYLNLTTQTAIATTATAAINIISAADSPATTTVGDLLTAGTPCQTDNGSRLKGFIKLHLVGTAHLVSILLWKDVGYGGVTDPTAASDILTPGSTSNLRVQKQGAMIFRRIMLSAGSDSRGVTIPIKGRNAHLREGESLKLFITNHGASNVTYTGYGRIRSFG